jgi:predicted cupin superfamily sugar epimerase
MQYTADYWINGLNLQEHSEGGYYNEDYRSKENIFDCELCISRSLATSIYYLLKCNQTSKFHRLISDEIWYFHAGNSLAIYCIDENGILSVNRLGLDLSCGEKPQIVVPGGTIFGAIPDDDEIKDDYSLVGCMVTPGFDAADYQLMSREYLLCKYPQYKNIIYRLT